MRNYLAAALFASAALNVYLPGISFAGFNLYGFRVLVVVTVAAISFGRLSVGTSLFSAGSVRSLLVTVCALLLWGFISMIWSESIEAGTAELLAVFFFATFAVVMLFLTRSTNYSIQTVLVGWISAFAVTTPVAAWELITGTHLPSAWSLNSPWYATAGRVASTFRNPNDYASFLVVLLPFALLGLAHSKNALRRFLFAGVALLGLILVLITASRLGLVAYIVVALYWLWIRRRPEVAFSYVLLLPLGLILAVAYFTSFGVSQLGGVFNRFGNIGYELQNAGSAEIRLNMALNAIAALIESYGFGIGAGAFEAWISSGAAPYDVGRIVNAHNLWLEILAQYGIVVFCLVVWWLYGCFRVAKASLTSDRPNVSLMSATLLCLLLAYVLAGFGSSSFLSSTINTMCVGSIAVLSAAIETATPRQPRRRIARAGGRGIRPTRSSS